MMMVPHFGDPSNYLDIRAGDITYTSVSPECNIHIACASPFTGGLLRSYTPRIVVINMVNPIVFLLNLLAW